MRIENLRTEIQEQTVRRIATIIWEDSQRPSRDIYFAIDEAYAADLAQGHYAFLTACLIPAMRHGERRIKLDEPIAPELRNGLQINMVYLRSWYGTPRNLVQIEASTERRQPIPRTTTNAASFLSGGVDSLATLPANRLNYPADHPYSIADCLMRLIAEWDVALRDLRVCTMNPTRGLNCGRCEKCLRTMLELLACGKLDQTSPIPAQDVTADQILNIHIDVDFPAPWYRRFLRGALYHSYRATRHLARSSTSALQLLAGTAAGLGSCVQFLGGLP